MNWYRDVQAQARHHMEIPWPQFYARAKEEAHNNPVSTHRKYRRHRSLFGGAGTKEYNAWYYSVRKAHAALPVNEQNWPEFYGKARTKAMIEHGLLAPHGFTRHRVPDKRYNVVPFNPITTSFDGPLRFDFSIPSHFNHHLINDNERNQTT
jgi:hypothetical protein